MAKTSTFSVNNTGDPEAVTVSVVCRKVGVGEDPSVASWPTTDFKVYRPNKTDTPRQIPAGVSYIFQKPDGSFYQPGDIAGYVATASGTTTFFQDEE